MPPSQYAIYGQANKFPQALVSASPWPDRWWDCPNPSPSKATCDFSTGLRWCSNGCLYYICGICVRLPKLPELVAVEFPWPPVPPPPPNGIIVDYKGLTEKHILGWLDSRGIKTDVVGKENLFEVAAKVLGDISCKVGVSGDIVKDA